MRTNLALFAFLASTAVACSKDSTSSPPSPPDLCANSGAAATVSANDNYTFTPDSVTITAGQSICWQNTGNLNHIVVEPSAGRFGGDLPGGQTLVNTIITTGVFLYRCNRHSTMTGTVVVNP